LKPIKNIRKTIRFSVVEFEKIEQQLQDNNLDFSTFSRSAILKKKINLPIEKELIFELNKIGNNLNQIAKAVNSNSQKIDILKELVKIEKELKKISDVC